jgi:osmoprotectant transport system ATP-binding protein
MASSPIIELIHVTKSFDGDGSHALRDVSLGIDAGSFVALVGSSGSGKTTALKTINRLLEPDSGEVRFAGEAVTGLDAPSLRRRIGYVFQSIGLFPHMTVGENIGITPQLLRWPKPDITAREGAAA